MLQSSILHLSDMEKVKKIIAVEVLGYTISDGLYLKEHQYPIICTEFNPMGNIKDAFLVLTAITQDANTHYKLSRCLYGHECTIEDASKRKVSRVTAWKPEVAICIAGLSYKGIRTDYIEPTVLELGNKPKRSIF